MKKNVKLKKKNLIILAVVLILFECISITGLFLISDFKFNAVKIRLKEEFEKLEKDRQKKVEKEIKESYNKYVKVKDTADLYVIDNDRHVKAGTIAKDQKIELNEIKDITYKDIYFQITSLEGYYIRYYDVEKTDALDEVNNRYKRYVPFNENVETNDVTNFFDENGNLLYGFNKSFNSPIYVKYEDKYGVEFNNRLVYVKKDEVKSVNQNNNSDSGNTSGVAVLNYHFLYDDTSYEERKDCDQSICLSINDFRSHLEYIKNNNIFTPTLRELEMYLDGNIQLPKSVVITFDDGWRMEKAPGIMEEYELNGTGFLVTSWYKPFNDSKYFEYHSHSNDLHNGGQCPGGQGGGIKCLDRNVLLEDLAKSREALKNTTYFCYPFYEYNNYSIEVLQEAGYTMAFIGGNRKASPGVNKFKVPRYPVYKGTSASSIGAIIG